MKPAMPPTLAATTLLPLPSRRHSFSLPFLSILSLPPTSLHLLSPSRATRSSAAARSCHPPARSSVNLLSPESRRPPSPVRRSVAPVRRSISSVPRPPSHGGATLRPVVRRPALSPRRRWRGRGGRRPGRGARRARDRAVEGDLPRPEQVHVHDRRGDGEGRHDARLLHAVGVA